MASIEEIGEHRRDEDNLGLPPNYPKKFSLYQFREELARLKETRTSQEPSGSVESILGEESKPLVLPNLRPVVAKVSRMFRRIAALF